MQMLVCFSIIWLFIAIKGSEKNPYKYDWQIGIILLYDSSSLYRSMQRILMYS